VQEDVTAAVGWEPSPQMREFVMTVKEPPREVVEFPHRPVGDHLLVAVGCGGLKHPLDVRESLLARYDIAE